jgi:hypothetical protein
MMIMPRLIIARAFGCVDSIGHVSALVDFSENVDYGTGMAVA